jgi:hypothetical protein
MEEKELIKQLRYLKRIKPDDYWKKSNREVLLSQITGSFSVSARPDFNISGWYGGFKNLFIKGRAIIAQPILVFCLAIAFILSGGILSINAARNTKPGDSLYIAKIINEKAKINLAFNEEKKTKLGLEFAANRAKEITQVLSGANDSAENLQKVEELSNNFKEEMGGVKSRLQKINTARRIIPQKAVLNNKESENKIASGKEAEIFGANLIKENKSVDIFITKSTTTAESATSSPAAATSSGAVKDADSENIKLVDLTKIIEEAEGLFNKKDYRGAIDKLEEVHSLIENKDGEVKDENEAAPSSSPVKN